MNIATKLSFALLFGLAVAGVPSSALAQTQGARETAIAKCVQVAQKAHPGTGMQKETSRTAAYKACMTKAGQTP